VRYRNQGRLARRRISAISSSRSGRGVPTTRFGDTQYFVADVRTVAASDLEVRPPAAEGVRAP